MSGGRIPTFVRLGSAFTGIWRTRSRKSTAGCSAANSGFVGSAMAFSISEWHRRISVFFIAWLRSHAASFFPCASLNPSMLKCCFRSPNAAAWVVDVTCAHSATGFVTKASHAKHAA